MSESSGSFPFPTSHDEHSVLGQWPLSSCQDTPWKGRSPFSSLLAACCQWLFGQATASSPFVCGQPVFLVQSHLFISTQLESLRSAKLQQPVWRSEKTAPPRLGPSCDRLDTPPSCSSSGFSVAGREVLEPSSGCQRGVLQTDRNWWLTACRCKVASIHHCSTPHKRRAYQSRGDASSSSTDLGIAPTSLTQPDEILQISKVPAHPFLGRHRCSLRWCLALL